MQFQDGGVEMGQVLPKEQMVEEMKHQASIAAMRRMSGEGRQSILGKARSRRFRADRPLPLLFSSFALSAL